jgi:hypothetical protein
MQSLETRTELLLQNIRAQKEILRRPEHITANNIKVDHKETEFECFELIHVV